MIGFGAVTMEVIYCALAFTGFASLFTGQKMKRAMELGSFVFMLYLGVLFLRVRQVEMPSEMEEQIEGRLNPHTAFAIGFVRVMANPGVFAFWIVLAAKFISRGWVQPNWTGKLFCVAGVAGGTVGLVQRLELRGIPRPQKIHGTYIVAHGAFFRGMHADPGCGLWQLHGLANVKIQNLNL